VVLSEFLNMFFVVRKCVEIEPRHLSLYATVICRYDRSLKVVVQGPALWPTLIHTYISRYDHLSHFTSATMKMFLLVTLFANVCQRKPQNIPSTRARGMGCLYQGRASSLSARISCVSSVKNFRYIRSANDVRVEARTAQFYALIEVLNSVSLLFICGLLNNFVGNSGYM
jgi:hypothetical protein